MEMIVNDAKRGASQSSSGAFIEEVNLVLPERILRRVQVTILESYQSWSKF